MNTTPKAKPKTLLEMAREVRTLLGDTDDIAIECSPSGAAIFSPKRDVALYGPLKPGWRSKNAKIIAALATEMKAKASVTVVGAADPS